MTSWKFRTAGIVALRFHSAHADSFAPHRSKGQTGGLERLSHSINKKARRLTDSDPPKVTP